MDGPNRVAGLPGPCYKLTATGWSRPHERERDSRAAHTAHYLHIYIFAADPRMRSPCFVTRRNSRLRERI